jgi:hypothetical protein
MRERAPNKTKQKNKNKTQKARGTSTREAGAVAGPVLQKQPLAQITKKKKKKKKKKREKQPVEAGIGKGRRGQPPERSPTLKSLARSPNPPG